MASATRCLTGALVSAAAMYWLDPTSGRRRRVRLREELLHSLRDARHTIDVGGRDLAHRAGGVAARVRYAFDRGEASDIVLAERVRACLGRAVSHPGAIGAEASGGCVTLTGDVLAHEYAALMRCVRAVRGVRGIDDQLSVHREARGISALQGGRPRSAARIDVLQAHWAPATRLLITAAGGALTALGLRRRTPLGALAAAAGGLAIIRSVTNTPLATLAGIGRPMREVRKTVHIHVPVETVFEMLCRFDDYPVFSRTVRGVRMHVDGKSHWTVAGPLGTVVEWDSDTSRFEPNRLIAWRTARHSPIQHSGTIRFEPFDGGTRLILRMSYRPPAGALGHALARLLGADPKSRLDEEMIRLKTFLETGKQPRDAAGRFAFAAGRSIGAAPTLTAAESTGTQPLH